MTDLLDRFFPHGDPETVLILAVFVCTAIGVWFFRKRLRLALPIAGGIVLVAAIAIPGCIPVHSYARRATCINNLKRITEAKARWSSANGKSPGDVPVDHDLFGPGLYLRHKPVCPSGGTYSLGGVGERPRCSLEARGHKLEQD